MVGVVSVVVDDGYVLPAPLALSRSTVDRAAHRRTDEPWLAAAWRDPATRVIVVGGNEVAVDGHDLYFVRPDGAPDGERFLLGVDDGVAYFAVHVDAEPIDGATLRQIGGLLSDRDAGLAVHAVSLANWHLAHTHCSRCGTPTEVACAGHTRRCPKDGSEHYPRTDPAVIVLVVDEDEHCLLGQSATWPNGRFSTLAGFVEPGETPEQAVVREVFEEVGVVLAACRYVGAQPWPFPSSLMLAYYASVRGVRPRLRPDGAEVVDARWFTRPELEKAAGSGEITLPGGVSIARRLVEGWLGHALADCR